MANYYISILKINIAEEAGLEFRLREIDETRKYVLDEIKQWFDEWKLQEDMKVFKLYWTFA